MLSQLDNIFYLKVPINFLIGARFLFDKLFRVQKIYIFKNNHHYSKSSTFLVTMII